MAPSPSLDFTSQRPNLSGCCLAMVGFRPRGSIRCRKLPAPGTPGAIWTCGDYHLRSEVGRWEAQAQDWVPDAVTSPCIDAGDPNSDWTAETWPHGGRINLGVYGGTWQASLSPAMSDSP